MTAMSLFSLLLKRAFTIKYKCTYYYYYYWLEKPYSKSDWLQHFCSCDHELLTLTIHGCSFVAGLNFHVIIKITYLLTYVDCVTWLCHFVTRQFSDEVTVRAMRGVPCWSSYRWRNDESASPPADQDTSQVRSVYRPPVPLSDRLSTHRKPHVFTLEYMYIRADQRRMRPLLTSYSWMNSCMHVREVSYHWYVVTYGIRGSSCKHTR